MRESHSVLVQHAIGILIASLLLAGCSIHLGKDEPPTRRVVCELPNRATYALQTAFTDGEVERMLEGGFCRETEPVFAQADSPTAPVEAPPETPPSASFRSTIMVNPTAEGKALFIIVDDPLLRAAAIDLWQQRAGKECTNQTPVGSPSVVARNNLPPTIAPFLCEFHDCDTAVIVQGVVRCE